MDKYAILLGYFDKQMTYVIKLYDEAIVIDITQYEKRFVFALRVQQFYTALENLFKQIAKSFENHIDNMSNFHKELLARMNTEVPEIRPAVISNKSLLLLDKVRSFRHFIRHAYDCELDEQQLDLIQQKLKEDYPLVESDLKQFRSFVLSLSRD